VAAGSPPEDESARLTDPKLAFELLESKFHHPPARSGIVPRTALLDRLVAAPEPVILVLAPPGYGKTTLLAQLASRLAPQVAWVSCDAGDNDPVVLLSAVAVAVNRIEPLDPKVFAALVSSGAGITFVPRLVSAMRPDRPMTVVLDHFEAVTNRECRSMIAELALRIPPGWRFALASRTDSALPTARLRAQGAVIEVGLEDLAMASGEASALLEGAGADVGSAQVTELVDVTEGWAVGLYLAALAIRTGARNTEVREKFGGDDWFVGDYLRSELLDYVSEAELTFLIRTSVLGSMSGPLCDAVVARAGSAQVLDELERRNLLVVPLDRRRAWYRYHHLLRDLLRSELQRRDPDLIPDLHRRAAEWYEANGLAEVAITHAEQAGDYNREARLVLELAQPAWASGRVETVLQWMEPLRDRSSAEHYAAIAVHGALIFALLGRAAEAERWADAAERAPATGILPDGSTIEATLAYLRAILFRHGTAQTRRDAQLAYDGLSPASPYRATMVHTEGLAYLLEGDPDRADPIFVRAYEDALADNAAPLAAMVLAERCFVASEHADWAEVTALARRAVRIVDAGGFEDYWTSALVYAWATRAELHAGDMTSARLYLGRAGRLRPLLTYALPGVSVQTLLVLARCYLAVSDRAGAGAAIRQARDILAQRPDLGTLPSAIDELQRELASFSEVSLGATSLTAAELRVLPLLSTHLSLREIGERLYISPHTVKSHTNSIYRKLEVTSRSEAVTRTHQLGLADGYAGVY
jgi:LuxR family maltose regulon positive regulatory protein